MALWTTDVLNEASAFTTSADHMPVDISRTASASACTHCGTRMGMSGPWRSPRLGFDYADGKGDHAIVY